MIISSNSQLGLRFARNEVKAEFLKLMIEYAKTQVSSLEGAMDFIKSLPEDNRPLTIEELGVLADNHKEWGIEIQINPDKEAARQIVREVNGLVGLRNIVSDEDSKYFLICDSVYRAAELIKIGENFTGRTLKDVALGNYTYLIGKHEMIRFIVVIGAVKGFYYNDKDSVVFEFSIVMESGAFYSPQVYSKIFSRVMQVLTFVELGDVEVTVLESGKNNGKPKADGKTTNTSKNTVYVVDSSWNKLIIRTEGFAVRGHFKLQPHGPGFRDRKLIWVNAFEKHGYTRRPKADIIHQ